MKKQNAMPTAVATAAVKRLPVYPIRRHLKSEQKTGCILLACVFLLNGCDTVKQCAPNSWNATVYLNPDNTYTPAFGISGPLPTPK